MDRSDILYLLTPRPQTKTAEGVTVKGYAERMVYCQVLSVSRSEFFEAGRNGLNPEFEFVMFAGDYRGERLVKYHDNTYAIYRTYVRRDDNIELYVQREGGANGKGN